MNDPRNLIELAKSLIGATVAVDGHGTMGEVVEVSTSGKSIVVRVHGELVRCGHCSTNDELRGWSNTRRRVSPRIG